MKLFERVELRANAKVNLSLDIIGVRPDGMHEVETVMHMVNLNDLVTFERKNEETGDRRIIITSNRNFIPTGEKNLAYRAAVKVLEDYPNRKDQINIHIQKRIPVGAGLGGGSSDAAATIKGINSLLKLGMSDKRMSECAASIGSDVPFLLGKGACLATGTGTDLKKIASLKNVGAVLVNPGIFVSTKDVYALYDTCDIPEEAHPDTRKLIDAMARNDYDTLIKEMKNVLEIPVFRMYPQIAQLKEELKQGGCDTALMSGSGSTVYGLSENYKLLEKIKSHYIEKGYKAFVVNFI